MEAAKRLGLRAPKTGAGTRGHPGPRGPQPPKQIPDKKKVEKFFGKKLC